MTQNNDGLFEKSLISPFRVPEAQYLWGLMKIHLPLHLSLYPSLHLFCVILMRKSVRGRLGRDKNNLSLCSIPLFTGLSDGEGGDGGDFLFPLDEFFFSLRGILCLKPLNICFRPLDSSLQPLDRCFRPLDRKCP